MNNRYRAGQPADLSHMLHRYTQCPAANSGCNGPKEGECAGLCDYPSGMPVQFAGPEPSEDDPQYREFNRGLQNDTRRLGIVMHPDTEIYYPPSSETPMKGPYWTMTRIDRIKDAGRDLVGAIVDLLIHPMILAVVLVVAVGLLVWSLR